MSEKNNENEGEATIANQTKRSKSNNYVLFQSEAALNKER